MQPLPAATLERLRVEYAVARQQQRISWPWQITTWLLLPVLLLVCSPVVYYLRLSEIKHLDSTPAVLSKQNYTYRSDGMIQTWTQQVGSNTPIQMALGYDPSSQLLSAVLKNTSTGDLVKQYSYAYDPAGNRTSEQAGSVVRTFAYGDGNAMSSVSSGGRIRVAGHLNEPGTVKVNGIPAGVSTNNFFESFPTVNTGTNNIPIISKDYSNNAVTNNLQVVIAPATSQTITRDANGNVTNDGNGKTYEYDACDRLTKITQSGDVTEFVYDGLDRCVQEKFNSTVTKKWIWTGTERIAELDSGNAVIKRFFGQGVQVVGASSPADKLYYTRDHLGSIRELTDSSEALRARYDYSPSGVTTKISGDLDTDFGFQGMYRHGSGLYLTLHRPYDPSLAAWLARDPLQERGGLNLYQAFANNPVNFVDPLGLSAWAMAGMVALVVLLPAAAIPALALGIFAGEILENAAGIVPQFVPCEYKVPVAIGLGLAAVVVPFFINPAAGVEAMEVRGLSAAQASAVSRNRVVLNDSLTAVGQWNPGSAHILINRNAVRYMSGQTGRTVSRELSTTAYHEAFHKGFYSVDRTVGRLLGVEDIYAASKASYKAGMGNGYWYRAEEWAAEAYGNSRSFLRNKWGIK